MKSQQQYNSHLLRRSNCNFSKCSLDKDIVFSKETLLVVFTICTTKGDSLGQFVNSCCSKLYKINEEITDH